MKNRNNYLDVKVSNILKHKNMINVIFMNELNMTSLQFFLS